MEAKYDLTDPYQIAKYIKEAKKSTPIKVYLKGDISNCNLGTIENYNSGDFYVLFGESNEISKFLEENRDNIKQFRIEQDRRNSAIPLANLTNIDARIEPGAIIRDKVKIDRKSVV